MTTTTAYFDKASSDTQIWTFECYVDHVFNNLMNNGYAKDTSSNKYIKQAVAKFNDFRIKSPETFFEIHKKDLAEDTKHQLDLYVQNCKNQKEVYRKLNGPFVEVIALIYKEAEPQITSNIYYEDPSWVEKAINETRTLVSERWSLV